MDQNLHSVMLKKVDRTIANLEKNNMHGHYVTSIEALHEKIKSIVPENSVVSVGGSMTLFETGVIDLLRNEPYVFLDRYAEGLTPEEIKSIFRQSFSADAYFASTNAITENGELYNVDGTGNRVAAMIFGPDKVIIIAGLNKIVKDLDEAVHRNREVSAPANVKRLSMQTPCQTTGTCSDCKSIGRICVAYTTIGFQRVKDRIHVIFVDGAYGY
ncbi:MAG: lactate utilization protein [Clostridia bacterium]|nr:lactate utilization protein [Clostridia bacterium]